MLRRGYRGGERQTELLIREFARRTFAQRLVARRGEPLASRLARRGRSRSRRFPAARLPLQRRRADVDLVHVHEGRSVYGAYCASFAEPARRT